MIKITFGSVNRYIALRFISSVSPATGNADWRGCLIKMSNGDDFFDNRTPEQFLTDTQQPVGWSV